MIEIDSLTKRYTQNIAVDNISFTVPKGKIYGFLGPNGAGKSTTMNMITGFLACSEGSVKIDGIDIYDEPIKAKRKMGYLPEQPPVYPDMTPLEYLYFVAELKGISKRERADAVLSSMQKTEIVDMQHRLIRNLSKGFCQRVGLAAALLGEPEVLILDEPTVGLDPKQIAEMRALIGNLRDKHTVLLSSHILSEVSAICDCVVIIAKGKIVALDTPQRLAALMHGKIAVTVTAISSESELTSAISNAMQDVEIEIISSTPQGTTAQVHGKVDSLRADIGKALMAAGLVCLELTESRITLEDVFLELTSSNDEIAASDEDVALDYNGISYENRVEGTEHTQADDATEEDKLNDSNI